MMNYIKIRKLGETNQGYRKKLRTERDYKKREELGLKIKINEFKIRIERLKN